MRALLRQTASVVRTVFSALIAFGLLLSCAALSYPGGSFAQPQAADFSFWHNFWCDLLSTHAPNGAPNVLGSTLARLAFACFAYALFRFWPMVAAHTHAAPLARGSERLGRFGACALLAVALVPSSHSELVHGVAVVASAGASAGAALLLVRPLWRGGERTSAWLGLLTVALALLCLAQYVRQGLGGHAATWLAGMQKITTIGLLALMVHVLARERRLKA